MSTLAKGGFDLGLDIEKGPVGVKLKNALAVVLTVLIVAAAINLVLREISGGSSPLAVVRGNSMYPLLREGDIIILTKKSPDEIKVGDVIVYKSVKGNLIVHRVIEVTNLNGVYYFKTKGDNNYLDDRYLNEYENGVGISQFRIVGVAVKMGGYVLKIPYLGSLALALSG